MTMINLTMTMTMTTMTTPDNRLPHSRLLIFDNGLIIESTTTSTLLSVITLNSRISGTLIRTTLSRYQRSRIGYSAIVCGCQSQVNDQVTGSKRLSIGTLSCIRCTSKPIPLILKVDNWLVVSTLIVLLTISLTSLIRMLITSTTRRWRWPRCWSNFDSWRYSWTVITSDNCQRDLSKLTIILVNRLVTSTWCKWRIGLSRHSSHWWQRITLRTVVSGWIRY